MPLLLLENVKAGEVFLGAGFGGNPLGRCSAISQSALVLLASAFVFAIVAFLAAARRQYSRVVHIHSPHGSHTIHDPTQGDPVWLLVNRPRT